MVPGSWDLASQQDKPARPGRWPALAALTGFFVGRSLPPPPPPPPPGLPALRGFQAAQGRAALAWLRERTGWS